jgi:ubiquinone/menaquinone biosynthesis C-methylase UbiE
MRTGANPSPTQPKSGDPRTLPPAGWPAGPAPCTVPASADGTPPTSSPTQPFPAAVIADIGCGRGTTTLTLADRFPRARIAAIDLSAAPLTAARNRTGSPGRAAAVHADFHRLPLADRSCDPIVAAFGLYHSPDPASVIAEIARCLSRGACPGERALRQALRLGTGRSPG